MKTKLVRAALACAVLALASTAAIAGGIPSVPIGLEGDPYSIVIAKGTTDANGNVTFRDLKPGHYFIAIDGLGLVAAVDKLIPPLTKKSTGPSVSVGGGLFGSGGGHSEHDGHSSHGRSGGGVGLGLSVPLGHGDTDPNAPGIIQGVGSIIYELSVPSGDGGIANNALRFELPYCRDGASQNVRIGFPIPEGAVGPVTVKLGISDQASSGNLTSY